MIDSRDFINAKRRADAQVLLPAGTRVAFTGGSECNDVDRIWAALDKVRAKYADMVLLHGGSPKGAELIAAKWASNRNVPQVVFKPDWAKHKNAAPFKRNDQILRRCRSASSYSPATASVGTWPTKQRNSASR